MASTASRRLARAIVVRENNILLIERNKDGEQFYTLPGGGIEQNESAAEAAVRELHEETSITAQALRSIYREHDPRFGSSEYVLCDYISGEPALSSGAPEHTETQKGHNTYEPKWVKIEGLEGVPLLPRHIARQLQSDLGDRSWPKGIRDIAQEELEIA